MTTDILDSLPLWAMFCGTILMILCATEVGYWAGQRQSEKAYEHNEAQITAMTGAHLGLLAFMLAFSFSMAAGNFEARKKVLLAETSAIETAYLRTSLVENPPRDNIRALLREYTALRGDATGLGLLAQPLQEVRVHRDIVPPRLNVHVELYGIGFGFKVRRVVALPEITYLSQCASLRDGSHVIVVHRICVPARSSAGRSRSTLPRSACE